MISDRSFAKQKNTIRIHMISDTMLQNSTSNSYKLWYNYAQRKWIHDFWYKYTKNERVHDLWHNCSKQNNMLWCGVLHNYATNNCNSYDFWNKYAKQKTNAVLWFLAQLCKNKLTIWVHMILTHIAKISICIHLISATIKQTATWMQMISHTSTHKSVWLRIISDTTLQQHSMNAYDLLYNYATHTSSWFLTQWCKTH